MHKNNVCVCACVSLQPLVSTFWEEKLSNLQEINLQMAMLEKYFDCSFAFDNEQIFSADNPY